MGKYQQSSTGDRLMALRPIHGIPKFGDFSPDVGEVQIRLNEMGADPQLIVDEKFGPLTRDAIQRVQVKSSLPSTGELDAQTLIVMAMMVLTQPDPKISSAPWLDAAIKDWKSGTYNEVPGSGDNPNIVAVIKKAGLSEGDQHDSTMWCGCYVFSKLLDAGIPKTDLPGSPAWAANWINFGVKCDFTPGAVACVPSKAANSGYHVTFANRTDGVYVYCVGGNQSNQVNESKYPIQGVMFRWPK